LNPKLATSLYGRAIAKAKLGDIAGAREDLSSAEAIQAEVPRRFKSYYVKYLIPPAPGSPFEQNLVWCQNRTSTPDLKIKGCTALIAIAGQGPQELAATYATRGSAFLSTRNLDKAMADFNDAIRLDPKSIMAFISRGIAYSIQRDHDHAIADYDEAIRLDPKSIAAFTDRGGAYLEKGDFARAISDFDEAIRINSQFAGAFSARCFARAATGVLQTALVDCNEALRLQPNDPIALGRRGFTYLKLGLFESAIADYDKATRLFPQPPSQPMLLYGRGIARMKKGDATGNEDIAAAVAIDANIAEKFKAFGVE
jgi:tetratricopeptide (TPR) repeat protein